MIRADQIPKNVVKAALEAWEKNDQSFRPNAETIAAALNAWPDVVDTNPNNIRHLVLQFKESQDE